MKKLLKCLLLFTPLLWRGAGGEAYSQNLVPNNSFETITQCPMVDSRIYYAPPWFQPHTWNGNITNSCSSDLFDTCGAGVSDVCIPQNAQSFQYARTGGAYAGIIPNADTFNYREYLEVPLLDTLITNHSYCVEYYVSLANSDGEAISNMGAYFSVDSLLTHNVALQQPTIDSVTPQIENPIGNKTMAEEFRKRTSTIKNPSAFSECANGQ